MKQTKTKSSTILHGINIQEFSDVASLITGQPKYEEALYDSDCWGE